MRLLLTLAALSLPVLLLPGCTRTLRTVPALIDAAPPIRPGFYTVHAVRGNTVRDDPGAEPFGKILHLYKQEAVTLDLTGSATARYAEVRGTFPGGGRIEATLSDGRVRHWWTRTEGRNTKSGEVVFDPAPRPGTPDSLALRLGRASDAPKIVLRFLSPRLPGTSSRTVYLAHRGTYYFNPPPYNVDGVYPANTLPAFQAALDSGYEGFELDVRISRDGKFITSHDDDLAVATDGSGRVADHTLEELKTFTVLGSPILPEAGLTVVKAFIAARMPGLREVLGRFLPDTRLRAIVVDIKPDTDEALIAAAEDAIEGIDDPEQLAKLIFVTRSAKVIAALRKRTPRSRFALEGGTGMEALDAPEDFIPELSGKPRGDHDTLSVNYGLSLAFPINTIYLGKVTRLQEEARRHDYAVVAWTVSDDTTLDVMQSHDLHPDYLLTDTPRHKLAVKQLRDFDPASLQSR